MAHFTVNARHLPDGALAESGLPIPMSAIRQQVARGIDLVVQIKKSPDGRCRIRCISEIGEVGPSGEIAITDLFRFVPEGLVNGVVQGQFKPTGAVPTMLGKLQLAGTQVDETMFTG